MFPKSLATESKEVSFGIIDGERLIKPTTAVALLVTYLAGCILGRSENPQIEDHFRDEISRESQYNFRNPVDFARWYFGKTLGFLFLNSLLCTLFFCWVCGIISDKYGRVRTMQLFLLLSGAGFAYLFSRNYEFELLGQFLLSCALGCCISAPIYLAEISPVPYRSFLLGLVPITIALGMFSMDAIDVLGLENPSRTFIWICFIGFGFSLFLHEAPEWLVIKNKLDAAMNSLRWLHESDEDADCDLRKLQDLWMGRYGRLEEGTVMGLFKKSSWKPYSMILGLALFQHLAGFYIMLFDAPYMVNRYRTTIYLFNTYIGSDFMLLIATVVALFLQSIFNRRSVAMISGITSAMALLGLLIHSIILEQGMNDSLSSATLTLASNATTFEAATNATNIEFFLDGSDAPAAIPDVASNSITTTTLGPSYQPTLSEPESKVMTVPTACFITYIVSVVAGVWTLPWIMIFEVFPIRSRGILCAASFSAMYALLFAFEARLNNYLLGAFELDALLSLFIVGSIGFVIYSRSVLVETHKKSFDEIERSFMKPKMFLPMNDEKI